MRIRIYRLLGDLAITVKLTENTRFHASRKRLMFRVCGRGVLFGIDSPVLLSERFGTTRVFRIGRLAIKQLRKGDA